MIDFQKYRHKLIAFGNKFLKNLEVFYRRESILLENIFLAVLLVTLFSGSLILIPWFQDSSLLLFKAEQTNQDVTEPASAEINKILKKLNRKTPSGTYLVINTAENKFRLYSGKKILRNGICSTGSYIMLEKDDREKWIFKTPKGVFTIREKKNNPVWTKPDWAFVEEGLPVPPINHPSRYEYGVLGEYSLSLGGGYLIHGTLYKRFLGMPVTHGCIRMNDDDLEAVYRTLPSGSKVYIY